MRCTSLHGPRSGPWPGSTHRDLLDGRSRGTEKRNNAGEKGRTCLFPLIRPSSHRPGRTATTASPECTRSPHQGLRQARAHLIQAPRGSAWPHFTEEGSKARDPGQPAVGAFLPLHCQAPQPGPHGGPQRQEGNRQPERTGAAERSFGPENKSGAPGARPLQGPSAESPRKAPKASPGLPGTQRGALCREDCHPVQHHQHGAVSRLLPGTQTCTARRLLGRTPPHDTSSQGADAQRP